MDLKQCRTLQWVIKHRLFYTTALKQFRANLYPKNQVKIGGRMGTDGADKAANKLANAALIFAVGCAISVVLYGAHFFIQAIK